MVTYAGIDNLEIMKNAKNYNNFLVSLVASQIKSGRYSSIVDFGSGDGYLTSSIYVKVNTPIDCVETAENMRSFYSNANNLSLHTSLCDFADSSVDFIYSLNVLEHVDNDKEIIDLFWRKLKTGGRALVYLPAFPCLYSSMDRKIKHIRRYRKKPLCSLFADKGFTVEKAYYTDFAGFFVTLLFKAFGNRKGDLNPLVLKFFDRLIFPLGRQIDKLTHGRFLGKNIVVFARKN